MLTPTYIIQFIEKRLGYKFNELEISHDEILENIRRETLLTFSKYFPYQTQTYVGKDTMVEGSKNRYYLESDLEIVGVARVMDTSAYYVGGTLAPYAPSMVDPFGRQILADTMSINKNPQTFLFEAPNIVQIQPIIANRRNTSVLLNCVHPDHFGTISVGMQDEFLKLALYDTKEVLYMIRHRFANLQTAFGNIELFVDDLQEATDKKEELFEKWRRNVGKQANRKKIYIG